MESHLVRLCLESACSSREAVDRWRLQRRTLDRMPPHLAHALLRRLLQRRLLHPSLLEAFKNCVEEFDLNGEVLVDAEWLAYIGGFQHLCCLRAADCYRITSSALWAITGLSTMKELDLSRCVKVNDAAVKHILSLSSLEKLSISETAITSDGISLLGSLLSLSELDLGGLPVTDQTLISLQVLKNLRHLNLWGSKVTDVGAVILGKFPKLNFLNLAWTKVSALPRLPALEYLNISNCVISSIFGWTGNKAPLSQLIISGANFPNMEEALMNIDTSLFTFLDVSHSFLPNFGFLSGMSSLEHLDLSSSGIKDDSLELFAKIGSKLRYLNLSKTGVTSDGVSVLAGYVPKLEVLSISHSLIDDLALAYIGTISSLKDLDLSHTRIKGITSKDTTSEHRHLSLTALRSLQLERLNIEQTLVQDDTLLPLCHLTELRHLSLQNNHLTDLSLHQLSPLQKLKTLGFRDAVLTARGLELYKPPKSLEMMDLTGCWLLSVDALKEFQRKHPRIHLRHEHILSLESHPSSGRYKTRENAKCGFKHRASEKLSVSSYFFDQRLKYDREELLALRISTFPLRLSDKDHAIFKTNLGQMFFSP
ncbi:hypothetical protein MLD38_018212 [Melastoma candidum]|uniref:Uncharacterized protein n=1 Tax=Melastoma candidum TaxID=119954 RepID=A0ACB9QT23_9MYRT|nr:hypothetical protein MLD38_018212 [Melastoma candidum]